jgi:murein DD-endopeptidase MepM/ murein hydrolase activator NlpD
MKSYKNIIVASIVALVSSGIVSNSSARNDSFLSAPVELAWVSGSDFGTPYYGKSIHSGVDLGGDEKVVSVTNGIVRKSGFDAGFGNYVLVYADDGTCHLYAHLDKIIIKQRSSVNVGDLIGIMGNTGSGSHGVHLHYEIRTGNNCQLGEGNLFVHLFAESEEELETYWINPHTYIYDENESNIK